MGAGTTLLIGTTKGLFIKRLIAGAWQTSGPFCEDWTINHAIGDSSSGTIWAAGGSEFNGTGVWRSDDGGTSWQLNKLANGRMEEMLRANPSWVEEFGREADAPMPLDGVLVSAWSLCRAGDTLYVGTKPAQLFKSTDHGRTWESVDALSDHPSRGEWEAGGAGMTLSSGSGSRLLVFLPARMAGQVGSGATG